MEPIVTDVFEKQPREIKRFPVSFAEYLAIHQVVPRAVDPITFDVVSPDDGSDTLAIDDFDFNPSTGLLWIKFSAGLHNRKYLVTMWLHTDDGQKIEHEITVRVKEQLK